MDDGAAVTAASRADGGTGAEGKPVGPDGLRLPLLRFSAEPLDGVPGLDLGEEADDLASLGEVLPPTGEGGAPPADEVGVTGAPPSGGGTGGKAPALAAAAAAAIDCACAAARLAARAGCRPGGRKGLGGGPADSAAEAPPAAAAKAAAAACLRAGCCRGPKGVWPKGPPAAKAPGNLGDPGVAIRGLPGPSKGFLAPAAAAAM